MSGALKKGFRNQGFALNWLLSGSMGNSMILCLNKSYLGGGKTKAVIGKEAVVIHTSWERDMFGHICGLGNVHVLSVLKHDY